VSRIGNPLVVVGISTVHPLVLALSQSKRRRVPYVK
jgi:hypothetical protein